MYSYMPFSLLFLTFLFLSTLMTISSSNIMIMWAAMELNMSSMIPLMTLSKLKLETEAAVKYFLAQALGSGLILITYNSLLHNPDSSTSPTASLTLLSLGILAKLGAAPMHFWFPSVMSSLPWPSCILLATWQKLAPLMMMMQLITPTNTILAISSALSAIIGGIMGINQTHIPSLIAYSSIGHLGWILGASAISSTYTTFYFLFYCLTSGTLMMLLHTLNTYTIKQFPSTLSIHPKTALSISILLLSLGGLPPLLGFAPKLIIMTAMIYNSHTTMLIPLIIGSSMNLSYYIIIVFNIIVNIMSAPNNAYQKQYISPNLILYITIPLFFTPYLI